MSRIHNIHYGLTVALSTICSVLALAQPEVVDRVVAVVGKEAILLSDLNAQIEFYAFNNRIDPETPGLQEQVLDAMINEKLMLARALEDTTIVVTEDEVTNHLDVLIAQRVQQVGSEKRLEELYRMPISRMKREFRDETRKQLSVQYLQQTKFTNVQVSRREVEEFYNTFKDSLPEVPEELELYHIFKIPKVSDEAKKEVRARAQLILDSIRAGGDFAEFAHRYSEDAGSVASGGDIGSVRRGQLVKEFEEVAFSLKENEVSSVVETSFGFHIIQLLERHGDVVHPRHILFKLGHDKRTDDSTIAFLKRLKDSVAQGGDFQQLAKRHSDDTESSPIGGFLGKLTIDRFDKSLLNIVKDLIQGEISSPVEITQGTTRGYQIVYLKRRVQAHQMNMTDDWNRIELLAANYKRNLEYLKWIQELREEIYWEIRL